MEYLLPCTVALQVTPVMVGRRDRILMQSVRTYGCIVAGIPFFHARSLLAVYIRYRASGLLQPKSLVPCTVALEVHRTEGYRSAVQRYRGTEVQRYRGTEVQGIFDRTQNDPLPPGEVLLEFG